MLPTDGARLAFTTDSFVVNPLFFPGGDIGKLAVYGTVNDLAMAGAKPAYLSAGFILEEGLPMETLRRVVASMAEAARTAGVRIVTGDTKVVDRGKGDGIFINTAGIGWVPRGRRDFARPRQARRRDPAERRPRPTRHGDHVGPRGASIRGGVGERLRPAGRIGRGHARQRSADIHCLRDLTRGGLAAALNEIALDARRGHRDRRGGDSRGRAGGRGLRTAGPRPALRGQRGPAGGVCAGCLGRSRAGGHVSPSRRGRPTRIGVVTRRHAGMVELRSRFGGGRIVDLLSGEQMPRIC